MKSSNPVTPRGSVSVFCLGRPRRSYCLIVFTLRKINVSRYKSRVAYFDFPCSSPPQPSPSSCLSTSSSPWRNPKFTRPPRRLTLLPPSCALAPFPMSRKTSIRSWIILTILIGTSGSHYGHLSTLYSSIRRRSRRGIFPTLTPNRTSTATPLPAQTRETQLLKILTSDYLPTSAVIPSYRSSVNRLTPKCVLLYPIRTILRYL